MATPAARALLLLSRKERRRKAPPRACAADLREAAFRFALSLAESALRTPLPTCPAPVPCVCDPCPAPPPVLPRAALAATLAAGTFAGWQIKKLKDWLCQKRRRRGEEEQTGTQTQTNNTSIPTENFYIRNVGVQAQTTYLRGANSRFQYLGNHRLNNFATETKQRVRLRANSD